MYTPRERTILLVLAVVGIAGLNGAFLWSLFVRPELIASALMNPVAAAFIVEALVLAGLLAYLLARWRVTRLHWAWFLVLSLAGGILFALPVALLWRQGSPGAVRSAG